MAVIRDDVIVAPSIDVLTSESVLNSTTLEPGIYTLNASKTIGSQTSTRWTVIAIAGNVGSAPVCYTQLWLPAQNNLSGADQKIYMRTINTAGTGYGSFTEFTNTASGINNKASYPTEIYIQGTQPTPVQGKNIIWIDTSS